MPAKPRGGPKFPWLATKPAKWVVGVVLAIPLLLILNAIRLELGEAGAGLGPNPGQELVEQLGVWAIRLLCLTLSISTLARLFRIPVLVQHRRTIGLFAFTYATLHFAAYFSALAGFELNTIVQDLSKRPYIIVGMIALCLLIPMAITSTRGWRRRLGLNWKRLHRIVYVIAIAAVIHLWMQERASVLDTVIYGSIIALLLSERIVASIRKRKSTVQPAA